MQLTLKKSVTKKGYTLPINEFLDFYVTDTKRIQVRVPSEEDVWLNVKKNEIEKLIFELKEVDIKSFM